MCQFSALSQGKSYSDALVDRGRDVDLCDWDLVRKLAEGVDIHDLTIELGTVAKGNACYI